MRPVLAAVGLVALVIVTGIALWLATKKPPVVPQSKVDSAIVLNNKGVGLMEMYEYADAAEAFQKARDAAPDWPTPHINYAIARMNQANEPDLLVAMEVLSQLLSRDPENLHAHYCMGIIIKYRNQLAEAVKHFEKVVALDDSDAGAWFHLGDCLMQVGENRERALECLERAFARNPYLRGPIWQLQGRLRADDPERADKLLKDFQQMEAAEVLTDLATRYTCMGSKYAEVIGKSEQMPVEASPPQVFRESQKFKVELASGARWVASSDFGPGPLGDLRRAVRRRFGGTIIRLDFNRDDKIDLFLLGAVVEGGLVRDLLLRNDGDGKFTDVTASAGLGGARPSLGACAADFDNDGRTDLLVTGAGVQRLFRNKGDGSFEDVTVQAGLDKISSVCLCAAWFDFEWDGDLDLVIGQFAESIEKAAELLASGKDGPGQLRAFLNVGVAQVPNAPNVDASLSVRFERLESLEKLGHAESAVTGFLVSDVDQDRDLDLIVLYNHGNPRLILNDRLLRFRAAPPDSIQHELSWNGALALDLDHDERTDLVAISQEKSILFRNRNRAGEPSNRMFETGATNAPPLRNAQAADIDLDGWTDIVGLSERGVPVFLANDRQGKLEHRPDAFGLDRDWPGDLIGVAVGDFNGDEHPDLIRWSESEGLRMRESNGNGNRCLKLALDGRRFVQKRPVLRTNQDGFGASVVVHAGRTRTNIELTTLSAGLGQSSVPVELGIGKNAKADAVRLRWPDLVVQAEIDVPSGGVRRITQTGRKPDSCPVIFTWNGSKFVYITDCLGAGSVGEMLAEGGTRRPRPEESVKIDGAHLQLVDGRYVIKIAEPMDEIMYLDGAKLVVIDHPADLSVFPDERFAVADPPPSQELLFFKDRLFPRTARTSGGSDATNIVREWDRRTVDDFRPSLWLGMAEEHWIELDIGQQLAAVGPKDRLVLCLAGWTQYAYPHTIFGLVQAGTPPMSPALEKQDAAGNWQPVVEIGFPAGEPRMMTVDLTGKLAGYTGKLRIRTNMHVEWDQIFLAPLVATNMLKPQVSELQVADAKLGFHGFCQEVSPDGRHPPLYDYDRLENVAMSNWQGWLTRFGDVSELLRDTDDRFVIGGPGDEVTLTFDAKGLAPIPAGWNRSFVLRTTGFCKDNAPFTATAGDVQPLPFRAMKQYPPEVKYPHPDDMKKWHTRRVGR
jgi:Tfp pilus assembly protein PilF